MKIKEIKDLCNKASKALSSSVSIDVEVWNHLYSSGKIGIETSYKFYSGRFGAKEFPSQKKLISYINKLIKEAKNDDI